MPASALSSCSREQGTWNKQVKTSQATVCNKEVQACSALDDEDEDKVEYAPPLALVTLPRHGNLLRRKSSCVVNTKIFLGDDDESE